MSIYYRNSDNLENVKNYGAVGDGSTDDTSAIQSAINTGKSVFLPHGTYATSSTLTAVEGASLIFDESSSIVRLSGSGNMISVAVPDFTIVNATIDLNDLSTEGITGSAGTTNLRLLGTTTIKNAATGGENTDGGVICASVNNLFIDNLVLENIRQNSGSSGLYRGIDLSSCSGVQINSIYQQIGDITVNIYGSVDVNIGSVVSKSITDNSVYIANTSEKVVIDTVQAINCGEGIVLNSSQSNAKVVIGDVFVSNASAYGITYRSGGGYMLGNTTLVESSIGTNGSSVRNNINFGNVRITMVEETGTRPVTMSSVSGMHFGSLDILNEDPLATYSMLLTDCEDTTIQSLNISSVSSGGVSEGFRLVGSDITAPRFSVGNFTTHRVTTPYTIHSSVTDRTNLFINSSNERYGNLNIRQPETASLQLISSKTACLAGNDLGQISIYGSDSSSPGTKFKLFTEAHDATGASRTYFLDDNNNTVAFIPANSVNSGMTIVLPTSSGGLPVGSIYNNNGVIDIVE